MQYRIREKDGSQHGPYSLEELVTLREDGVLTASSMIAANGTDDFRLARLIPGLFEKKDVGAAAMEAGGAFAAQARDYAAAAITPSQGHEAGAKTGDAGKDWSTLRFEQPTRPKDNVSLSRSSATSRRNGQSVVNWMWGLCFTAWGACFVPIPGVSTVLVWIFACLASLVAFVAMLNNRVGSGVAGVLAIIFVTPAVWFFSLFFYANLLFSGMSGAESLLAKKPAKPADEGQVSVDPSRSEPAPGVERTENAMLAEMPPLPMTIRDPCLAWKCGSDGRVMAGKKLTAYEDYNDPGTSVVVNGETSFRYIETVSVTIKPEVTQVVKPFSDPVTGHGFEVNDIVYVYANWGEGCVTAWTKGQGFGFSGSGTPDGGHDKTKVGCIATVDSGTGDDLLSHPPLEAGDIRTWTFAEFDIDGSARQLYFQDHDAVSTE